MERRNFIRLLAASSLTTACSAKSQSSDRVRTISQQEGPYYPLEPIALRADLLINSSHSGQELQLTGLVADTNGSPVANARVEIWQCDAAGVYPHPSAPNSDSFDPNFAGSGATMTSESGQYQFRTIMPVPYTSRPPHIHTKVFIGNDEILTSQIYLTGAGGPGQLQMDPIAGENSIYTASFDFVV